VAVWRRGAARSRDSTALHYNLALAYAQRQDYEAALREITRALEIAPDDSTARSLRDTIEEEMGR
jgi:Flp pilus assembly protein TadD